MCQSCINKKASASFRHTLTCSFEEQVSELQLEKREIKRGAFLGEDFLYLFELSLGIVLVIYNKKVFSP
jgi:hypothetical protein